MSSAPGSVSARASPMGTVVPSASAELSVKFIEKLLVVVPSVVVANLVSRSLMAVWKFSANLYG